MCDKCQYNRVKVVAMGEEMSSAEKSREFYRRQGECRERERIIKLLEARLLTNPQPTDTLGSFSHAMHNQMIGNMIALIKGEN